MNNKQLHMDHTYWLLFSLPFLAGLKVFIHM